eukprot:411141_1
MPQIRTISRQPSDRIGYHRNFSTNEHRFARAREYTRALRAAKLERLHAKPFVRAYDGHVETVCKIEKVRNSLTLILSADYDGEIRCWDINQHLLNWRVQGHNGRCMDLTVNQKNNLVISTGIDKKIKLWKLISNKSIKRSIYERDDAKDSSLSYIANKGNANNCISQSNFTENNSDQKPISTINHYEPLRCIDFNWQSNSTIYATGSSQILLWDINRQNKLHKFNSTPEQCVSIAFNPSQYNLLASCMQDSKITFYDIRSKTTMSYITLLNWANEISWNPIDPRIFAIATNDWCCYTFDIRYLKKAIKTHRGHVDSVTSIDWSPNGKEFVTGSVDGHIRIWNSNHSNYNIRQKIGYSKELYKNKRMYNLEQVRWTYDNKYILSGSADGVIRLWKSNRSKPLYKINKRQKNSIQYSNKLIQKYKHINQIGLINRFRNAKIPHRIPRNGVYYKKERFQQKRLKELKEKVNPKTDKRKIKRDIKKDKKWRKKNKTWAQKVVQQTGIIADYQQ